MNNETTKTRLPTTKELINAMVKILIAYHLCVEGKQTITEWNNMNMPELAISLVPMAYAIPIGAIIESDPLLSQHKQKVYDTLAKMINEVSTTKGKEREKE